MTTLSLNRLVARWEEAYRQGRDLRADELCPDRPDLVAELDSVLLGLRKIRRGLDAATLPLPGGPVPTLPLPSPGGTAPATLDLPGRSGSAPARAATLALGERQTEADSAGRTTLTGVAPVLATPADMPKRIGRFEIRGFLGEGGFGRVYQAFDPSLKRLVALKVSRPDGGARWGQMVLGEAQASAHLMHPYIVAVFDTGRDGPLHYIASAFIAGHSLQVALEGLHETGPMPVRTAAEVVRKLAEALAYAHQEGVIHRDVKPGNVMLREDGEPLLMDFGLASRGEGIGGEKSAMGTPPYMAPEQWAGNSVAASDQYALGCTLFQLLTGELPFAAGSPDHFRLLHETQPAPSPRSRRAGVPPDLEAVCLKCLAKEPAGRYPDCQALADDLRRLARGEPVAARPVGVLGRTWRWSRRNPAAALLTVAVLVTLATGAAVSTALAVVAKAEATRADEKAEEADGKAAEAEASAETARREEREALAQKRRADEQRDEAEWLVYTGKLALAQSAWEENRADRALAHLSDCQWSRRGWEHRHLETLFTSNQGTLRGHTEPVTSVAWSPDGKYVAGGDWGGTLKVWDAGTGRTILTRKGRPTGSFWRRGYDLTTAPWGADGKGIDGANWDETHEAREAAQRRALAALNRPDHPTSFGVVVAWSPDGKRVAIRSNDARLKVYDTEKGRVLLSVDRFSGDESVAWSPDGKRITTGILDQDGRGTSTLKVWDAGGGRLLLTLKGRAGHRLKAVAWSPDGRRIATGSDTGEQASRDVELKVWDAEGGQELLTLRGHTFEISSLAWSPDGRHFASGSADMTVKVWDAEKGREVLSLKGHTDRINSVAWSPDGRSLASGGGDKTVKVWDVERGQEAPTLKGHTSWVTSVAWSPDGGRIASAGYDTTLKVWDAGRGRELLTARGLGTPGSRFIPHHSAVAWSPDGKRVAGAGSTGMMKVWDAETGKVVLTFKGDDFIGVAWSPDGKRLASGSRGGTLTVWDADVGRELLSLDGRSGHVTSMAWSPDGKRLAHGSTDSETREGTIQVWDPAGGRELLTLKGGKGNPSVAWSPDGKRLAIGNPYGTLQVRDAGRGGEVLSLVRPKGEFHSVAWSPDGKRIASGGGDGTLKVWDASVGRELLSFKGHTGYVLSVSWSPDGRRLASGGWDKTVKVWEAGDGRGLFTLKGHTGEVRSVACSPDGRRVLGRDDNGVILLWDATTGRLLPDAPKAMPPGAGRTATSPDGKIDLEADGSSVRLTFRDAVEGAGRRNAEFLTGRTRFDSKWHRRHIGGARAAGDAFAAAFHLGRLLLRDPADASLHAERAYAVARLGRLDEAAGHFAEAVRLRPGLVFPADDWPAPPAVDPTPPAAEPPKKGRQE